MYEVKIRQSKFEALAEHARLTGVSVWELVDEALSQFIEEQIPLEKKASAK